MRRRQTRKKKEFALVWKTGRNTNEQQLVNLRERLNSELQYAKIVQILAVLPDESIELIALS